MEFGKTLECNKGGLILLTGVPGAGKSFINHEIIQQIPKGLIIVKINFDKTENMLRNQTSSDDNDLKAFLMKQATTSLESLIKENIDSISLITEDDLFQSKSDGGVQDYDRFKWKENRKLIYDLVLEIVQNFVGKYEFKRKFIIILDDNFLLNSMIKPYYRLAARCELSYCELYVKTDLSVCLERNAQRNSNERLPEDVVIRAYNNYESTNYPQNQVLFENNQNSSSQNLLNEIFDVLNKVKMSYFDEEQEELQKNKFREITKTNLIHQLDLSLRSAVACILAPKKEQQINQDDEISLLIQSISVKFENSKEISKLVSSMKSLFLEIITALASKSSLASELHETERDQITEKNWKNFKKYAEKINQDPKHFIQEFQIKSMKEWSNVMKQDNNLQVDEEISQQKIILSLTRFWTHLILEYILQNHNIENN